MKIIIGGDLVPTEKNEEHFKNGEIENVIEKKILDIIQNADYRIFNLEAPITNFNIPIYKCGPALKINKECINGIKKINPSVLSISNNHILDYGIEGLKDTIDILDNNNILHLGASNIPSDNALPLFIEDICIYSVCEHEFSVLEKSEIGANGYDKLNIFKLLSKNKKNHIKTIILFHGGKEEYRYPTPMLQKVCREICDMGATLVICQHSHCIGCFEEYKNGKIIYGQGNFIFDYDDTDCWKTGLLVQYDTAKDTIEYIPLENKNGKICFGSDKIINDFNNRSCDIKKKNFVEKNYDKIVDDNLNRYIEKIASLNRVEIKLNRIFKGKILKKKYSKKQLLNIKNYIECESHREMLLAVINKMINDK